MRGAFEFTGFAGLALALHVAAFQSLPQGSASSGAGGDALVTVAAASGSLSEMVAEWDRPPEVSAVFPAAFPQPAEEATFDPAPRLPEATKSPAFQPPRAMAPVLPSQDGLPTPDVTRTAPRPPDPVAEVPPIRPQARPAAAPAKPKPSAKPAHQPPARAAATAAGSGAASARGTSGPAETASLSKAARQSLLAEWGGKIRNRIDRAKPRGAGRGSVIVVLSVGRDGALQSVGIATSSGQAALDQQAVKAIRSAGRLPAAPAALDADSYTFRLPIRFD